MMRNNRAIVLPEHVRPEDVEIRPAYRPTERRARSDQRLDQLADQQWRVLKEVQELKAALDAAAAERSKWETRLFSVIGLALTVIALLITYIFFLLSRG
jgi:hypothetical protein